MSLDDYEKRLELGRGSYGIVWLGIRKSDGRAFAIKEVLINSKYIDSLQEIDLGIRVQHPNIISLEGIFIGSENFYFILPLAERDLGKIDFSKTSEHLRIKYIYQIISAVSFLHRNYLYHCDLKPNNILVTEDDNILVSDLGRVRYDTVEERTCAIRQYRPPEVYLKNNLTYNGLRSMTNEENLPLLDKLRDWTDLLPSDIDTWCTGLLIYFILNMGKDLVRVDVDMSKVIDGEVAYGPEEWKGLLEHVLHPDPEKRLRSIDGCFNYKVLRSRGYTIPAQGSIVTKAKETLSCGFKGLREYVLHLCTKFQLSVAALYNGVHLFYRVSSRFKPDQMELALITCMFIASSLIDEAGHRMSEFAAHKESLNRNDIRKCIERILQITSGILVVETLYTHAFSAKSSEKGLDLLFDCEAYKNANFFQYMMDLPDEDPESRQPKEKAKF
jgi:serine/threonine protein kinase